MTIKNDRRIYFILTMILCVCLGAGICTLSQYTLASFGTIAACFAATALISGTVLWKSRLWIRLTGTQAFLPNYLCHSVCTGILGTALFYIGNYGLADDAAGHLEKAVVEETYYKVRHKTRRVSRGRYARGDAYNVYYMKASFGDGSVKDFEVERKKYVRLHKGDTVELFISKGFFGFPVVKYNKLTKYTYGSRYRETH